MAPTSTPSYLTQYPSDALPEPLRQALAALEPEFDVDLHAVTKQMLWEFSEGLNRRPDDQDLDEHLPMIPTYVHDVPNGSEKGKYLALDLGGTNLRVCEVTLTGEGQFSLEQRKFHVSEQLKTGPATELFDYIAQSVSDFVDQHGSHLGAKTPLDLAFTFSFPVEQTALDKGKLINWTKGFSATGAVSQDVPGLLQAALERKKVPVKVSALVNDTVGTLLASAYQQGHALCGAIFGTGTNGAFVVDMEQLGKFSADERKVHSKMIINTEWGAFDNKHDNTVDRTSINPRKQAYEKMISGLYLGEVTRVVLLSLIDRQLLFKGRSTQNLNKHYGLDTELMSLIEENDLEPQPSKKAINGIRSVLENRLNFSSWLISDADCIAVRRVSEIVGTRGARLSACAIAAVVKQVGVKPGTETRFGVDGSVVAYYPGFEDRLRLALKELLGEQEKDIKIDIAKDGSGVGAALCACMAAKQREAGISLIANSQKVGNRSVTA